MTLAEVIKTVFLPQALSIGIDYNLFWTLNPAKIEPFMEAEKIKQKNKYEDLNYACFLQGYYNLLAIGGALDPDKYPYPTKPIGFAKKEDAISERKAAAIEFEAWAIKFNKHILKADKQSK